MSASPLVPRGHAAIVVGGQGGAGIVIPIAVGGVGVTSSFKAKPNAHSMCV
jgi:hypothetical protein